MLILNIETLEKELKNKGVSILDIKKILESSTTELCECKDCIYSRSRGFENDTALYCYYWDYEAGSYPNSVYKNDYCSNGVRKTNGDNNGKF